MSQNKSSLVRVLPLLSLLLSALTFFSSVEAAQLAQKPLRRVKISCETTLLFGRNQKSFHIGEVVALLGQLPDLLERYAMSSDYYEVPNGDSENLPTTILEVVGELRLVSMNMTTESDTAMRSINQIATQLAYEIYRPQAVSELNLGNLIDPESEQGRASVNKAFVASKQWLADNGWLTGDRPEATKITELRHFLSQVRWTSELDHELSEKLDNTILRMSNTRRLGR